MLIYDMAGLTGRAEALARSEGPPAIVGHGEGLTWRDVAESLRAGPTAGSTPATVLEVSGRPTDVLALLGAAASCSDLLVLDARATEHEKQAARLAFTDNTMRSGGPSRLHLCTSGSTGHPVVAASRWDDVLANAAAFARAAGYAPGDVIWCTTPLHHRYCLAAGVLAGLLTGCTLVLEPGLLGPDEFTTTLKEHHVSVVLSVPFLYRLYLGGFTQERQRAAGRGVRRWIAAGEQVPEALADAWRRASGSALVAHYGTTEDGQIAVGRGAPGEGVGRPLEDTEVCVSETGTLLVRRRGALAWRDTGDLGHIDEAGNVHVTGRGTDRLNVGGKKVDPKEVETVLLRHSAVTDCTVIGVQGGARGGAQTDVVAVVVKQDDVNSDELRRHVGRALSPHKVPRRYLFVDEVPRTRTGKVRGGALLDLVQAHERNPAAHD